MCDKHPDYCGNGYDRKKKEVSLDLKKKIKEKLCSSDDREKGLCKMVRRGGKINVDDI